MYVILILMILFGKSLLPQQTAKAEIFIVEKNPDLVRVCLNISLNKGWHIYWINNGDIGIPTDIKWTIPNGYTITDTEWPVPDLFYSDDLISFGYEDNLTLIYQIKKEFESDSDNFTCEIKSLICRDVCVPFDNLISFNLNDLDNKLSESEISEKLENYYSLIPIKNHSLNLTAMYNEYGVDLIISKNSLIQKNIENILFIPFENGIFEYSNNQNFTQSDDRYKLSAKFNNFKTRQPDSLDGLLVVFYRTNSNSVKKTAYQINLNINN